jgi:hypothetical protein
MEQKDDEKSDVKRDGWSADKISDEAANKEPDEVTREIARGGEDNKDNADDRDIVGSPERDETPHGREETKKQ